MNNTFGFIGTGNMGGALARAAAKVMAPETIFLSNKTHAKAELLAEQLHCAAVSPSAAAATCGYILLGVKPQMMAGLLADLAPILAARTDRFILVSMAASLTMDSIRKMAGGNYPVIRIMPNTPISTGHGVILYDCLDVTEDELTVFTHNLSGSGLLDRLPEHLMDAGTAVAGCGPALADLFVEALADAGVVNGLPRAKAQRYAAQMLKGAAALILESGQHPGQLKDAVCSPGGSTIAGVRALEQRAFRAAVMEAVDAAVKRTKELGK